MENRFKIRVWDKINEKWMHDTKLICDLGVLQGFYDNEQASKRRYILIQCTGLKDKNGKLIYEGYIVKFKNFDNKYYIGTIKYIDEDALFCLSYINENNRLDWDYVSHFRLEVIGNIYENPELLEDNNDNIS